MLQDQKVKGWSRTRRWTYNDSMVQQQGDTPDQQNVLCQTVNRKNSTGTNERGWDAVRGLPTPRT